MIYQTMPRKGYEDCHYDENKGFFIEGRNREDCIKQLNEYCKEHPEKWVYYHDAGFGVASYSSIGRYVFEVMINDKEPAGLVMAPLYQSGCENKHEFDDLSKEEQAEVVRKQLNTLALLGSMF